LNKDEEAFEPVLEPFSNSNQNELPADDAITDDIRSRLKALKTHDQQANEGNVDEIAERLANLKGVKDLPSSSKKITLSNDRRSDQEKISDLLDQVVAEANIDIQMKPEDEEDEIVKIEKRLAALRGVEYKKRDPNELIGLPEKTEDEECSDVMQKYLEEAKLEVIAGDPDEEQLMSTIPAAPGGKKLDELPFCEICNEDATLRCMECENLFCLRCFKEFHDEEDYKDHPTKPYKAPKNKDDV
jgi:abscission/NoCut checkpoint regulator